ncbi:MAG: YggT family protein [Burkholderiales bacterium]|jgi:YggT family protein
MLSQILHFLLDTIFSFFVFVLLARFYLQLMRAPFRNPLGQFVTALTNWLVLPARRVIPGMFGLDLASFLLAWLLQALLLLLLYLLRGGGVAGASGMVLGVLLTLALLELARLSLYLLIGVILIQAVISWINPYAPLAPLFNALAAPFLRPFRRLIPPIGNVDLSPLFALVAAQLLLIPLEYLARSVAALF